MRLLNTKTLQLEQFSNHGGYNTLLKKGSDLVAKRATPRYAILSHTWGEGEIIFQDMQSRDRSAAKKKRGWRKLEDSCKRAARDGFEYIWIDTCCIDKTSSSELSEAIGSMFQWYKESALCYAFLEDCQGPLPYKKSSSSAEMPRWYSRGWTLQELIAPRVVHFYSLGWQFLGTKDDHAAEISRLTGIDTYALGGGDLSRISIARRMSWVAGRKTTRLEDMAYSVMGIFNISMPLLYGEGPKAFTRLQEEIMQVTDDQSVFAWSEADTKGAYRGDNGEGNGLLAFSPSFFASSSSMARFYTPRPGRRQTVVTSQGAVVNLLLCHDTSSRSNDIFFAILDCQIGHVPGVLAGIRLKRKGSSGNDFMRIDTSQVFQFARLERDGSVAIEGFDPTQEQTELVELKSRMLEESFLVYFGGTIMLISLLSRCEIPQLGLQDCPCFTVVSPTASARVLACPTAECLCRCHIRPSSLSGEILGCSQLADAARHRRLTYSKDGSCPAQIQWEAIFPPLWRRKHPRRLEALVRN